MNTAVRAKRQPVPVDATQYEFMRNYSKLTGIPIARIVRDAIQAHIDVTLSTRLEALAKYTAGDRMAASEVPDTPIEPSARFTADDAMSAAPVLEASPAPAVQLPDSAPAVMPDWAQDA
jgi:hypothetical protein